MIEMAEQRLWAPWRLEYIKGTKTGECIFCTKPALGDDDEALIPYRGKRCFVILNAFPYNNGHLMVAPYEHGGELEAVDDETSLELVQLTKRCMRALSCAYGPEGFNVGLNQGTIAGAGMADHVHFHIVPRWGGDTNYMPVIADTRVLPQSLVDSYHAVRDAFQTIEEER
jgi:ATP adenylyltransferase